MIYLLLAIEFFKTGLFSYGGGYATIPFLYNISLKYGWYSLSELTKMTAVASITPGPIGINIATYAGIKSAGILGAIVATISEIIPSLFFVIIVSNLLNRFGKNFYVKSAIETLKPISCALLLSVGVGLIKSDLTNIKIWVLLGVFLILSRKVKKEPLLYILIGGMVGLLNVFI
ncbi:MAG: chromate transporter [bacterium]|nr:chromate transporter [bacterium]